MSMDLDFSKMTEGEALYSLGARAIEKDGKKGLNLPIPGKPGQTLFIQASDEKPGTIVASEHKESRLKGSKKTRCADCRRKVWISPSTQEMLKRYPGVPVICIACFVKRAEEENKQEKEASQGQVGNHRRQQDKLGEPVKSRQQNDIGEPVDGRQQSSRGEPASKRQQDR